VWEPVGGLVAFGYGGSESRHVSESKSPIYVRNALGSYSPILVHSLTIAQSDCNELVWDVCEFVGGLVLFSHSRADSEQTRF
jgi:hypothetical protein